MFDVTNGLVINGIDMHPYITEAKFGFYDTWGEDTGYTMANTFTGTFKGTIPKFTVKFAKGLTSDQLYILTNYIFRPPQQSITYKDPDGSFKTLPTHKGDLVLNYKGLGKHDAFTMEFVGNERIY